MIPVLHEYLFDLVNEVIVSRFDDDNSGIELSGFREEY